MLKAVTGDAEKGAVNRVKLLPLRVVADNPGTNY